MDFLQKVPPRIICMGCASEEPLRAAISGISFAKAPAVRLLKLVPDGISST